MILGKLETEDTLREGLGNTCYPHLSTGHVDDTRPYPQDIHIRVELEGGTLPHLAVLSRVRALRR